MKTRMIPPAVVLAAMAAMLQPAQAHDDSECHFHDNTPASERTVTDCADHYKEELVEEGKLGKAWLAISHHKIETVSGKKGKEWKVAFTDPAAADKSKATLYMFFTLPGNFIAANFDGK